MTGFICFAVGFIAGGVIGVFCMAAVAAHKYDPYQPYEEEGGS